MSCSACRLAEVIMMMTLDWNLYCNKTVKVKKHLYIGTLEIFFQKLVRGRYLKV